MQCRLRGDINGDGFADVVVGAPGNDAGGEGAGAAYVIFGKSGFSAQIDLNALTSMDGFVIQGAGKGDAAGYSVASAGDFNGDGFADIIVGAKLVDLGGRDAGAAYVIFGKADGTGDRIDLANLTDVDGFVIQGDIKGDLAGFSVASAGDVNGDGFADLFVGAPAGDDVARDAGEAYVIFGVAPTEAVHRVGTAIGNTIRGGPGDDTLDGRGGNDVLSGAEGSDRLLGKGGNDDLNGGDGDDALVGGVGDDLMHGGDGRDVLSGGRGVDVLYGGEGQDRLSGGADADVFHFSKNGTSADARLADRIVDFHQGEHDLIDLTDYDADPSTKKIIDPFTFVGTAVFSGAVGELRYEIAGSDTLVSGDTNGDSVSDFVIRLTGNVALTAADFLFAVSIPTGGQHLFLTHPDLTTNHLIQLA